MRNQGQAQAELTLIVAMTQVTENLGAQYDLGSQPDDEGE